MTGQGKTSLLFLRKRKEEPGNYRLVCLISLPGKAWSRSSWK